MGVPNNKDERPLLTFRPTFLDKWPTWRFENPPRPLSYKANFHRIGFLSIDKPPNTIAYEQIGGLDWINESVAYIIAKAPDRQDNNLYEAVYFGASQDLAKRLDRHGRRNVTLDARTADVKGMISSIVGADQTVSLWVCKASENNKPPRCCWELEWSLGRLYRSLIGQEKYPAKRHKLPMKVPSCVCSLTHH
jgi:hypothetical protein